MPSPLAITRSTLKHDTTKSSFFPEGFSCDWSTLLPSAEQKWHSGRRVTMNLNQQTLLNWSAREDTAAAAMFVVYGYTLIPSPFRRALLDPWWPAVDPRENTIQSKMRPTCGIDRYSWTEQRVQRIIMVDYPYNPLEILIHVSTRTSGKNVSICNHQGTHRHDPPIKDHDYTCYCRASRGPFLESSENFPGRDSDEFWEAIDHVLKLQTEFEKDSTWFQFWGDTRSSHLSSFLHVKHLEEQ